MVSWLVGSRNSGNTKAFMADVAERLANHLQLTTDGIGWYVAAVEDAFGWNGVDFAQIIKTYGIPMDETERLRRHSPAVCTGAIEAPVMGYPDMALVCTSFVERSNLTIHMGTRRFTPLTNGFSKKAENHAHAVSLPPERRGFAAQLTPDSFHVSPLPLTVGTDSSAPIHV